jgi:hypothetical protein
VRCLSATVALALFAAAPAAAQETFAPPGNAGVDEYLETVPEAGGARPRDRRVKVPPVLPGEVRGQLQAQGADGAATADLAENQAPVPQKTDDSGGAAGAAGGGQSGTGGGGAASGGPISGEPRPAPAVVAEALTGSEEGAELWFPSLLLASGLAALAFALRRRRSAPPPLN